MIFWEIKQPINEIQRQILLQRRGRMKMGMFIPISLEKTPDLIVFSFRFKLIVKITAFIPENCCPACNAITRHRGNCNRCVLKTRIKLHFSWLARRDSTDEFVSSQPTVAIGRPRNFDNTASRNCRFIKRTTNSNILFQKHPPSYAWSSDFTTWWRYLGLSGSHGNEMNTSKDIHAYPLTRSGHKSSVPEKL